jgi:hypothetical protein
MVRKILAWVALLGSIVCGKCLSVQAAERTPETIAKAEKAARDHLEKLKGSWATVQYIKDEDVEAVSPHHYLFSVLFRQFPVARPLPEGLTASNLLVVDGKGKATVLRDAAALEKFFKTHATAKKEEGKKAAVRAWLRLSQQYHQDGFYIFDLVPDSVKVEARKASGVVTAMRGGGGTLHAELTFDDDGKLDKVREEAKLRRGPRPICQASKLLDPDPLVRRIVEQDLLIMGTAAKDYLDEQRAQATPELRRAIDRRWQRIVESER